MLGPRCVHLQLFDTSLQSVMWVLQLSELSCWTQCSMPWKRKRDVRLDSSDFNIGGSSSVGKWEEDEEVVGMGTPTPVSTG